MVEMCSRCVLSSIGKCWLEKWSLRAEANSEAYSVVAQTEAERRMEKVLKANRTGAHQVKGEGFVENDATEPAPRQRRTKLGYERTDESRLEFSYR